MLMRSVTVLAAAVLAAALGTFGINMAASAAPAAPVAPTATAPVSSYNWLNGVACSSAKDCVAVGAVYSATVGSVPLAEQWNGKSWKTLAVKLPAGGIGGQLYGVSCKSGKCVAAGQFYTKGQHDFGLAETWNGTSWSAARPAEPHGATSASLLAISCAAADRCVATGSYWLGDAHAIPLAETWNGKSWTAATPPVPAGSTESVLNGVSCPSAARCMAVGQATNSPVGDSASALIDEWNGKFWTRVAVPVPSDRAPTLVSVSCTSTARCVAIGNTPPTEEAGATLVTFAETWNGAKWTDAVIPKPAISATLAAVACASATKCLAVGNAFSNATPFGNDRAYAAALNGAHWSLTKTPPTPVNDDSLLRAAACASPTACMAVGLESLYTFEAPYSTAALWNGSTWKAVNPPR
jgi:hypothetical protein